MWCCERTRRVWSAQFAGGVEKCMHGAGGLADGVEDADGVLEVVDAGADRTFGKGDMTRLDGEGDGVSVSLVGAV